MSLLLPGDETAVIEGGRRLTRHHHARPYAAVLVEGACDEVGDRGRFRAAPGDVFVHAAFDGHANVVGQKGAVFINLALDVQLSAWHGAVADIDSIAKAHERHPAEAVALLKEQFRAKDMRPSDWPDVLAKELTTAPRFSLEAWADRHRLHPTSVSRGFRRVFGLSPQRFRLEIKASRAARRICGTSDPLATIAVECGFSDQAHMSRTIARLFNTTPVALRRVADCFKGLS